ncbi:MAG: type II toxin-antitoxin system RelE/ParE family toxin [Acidobacteriota bacterium]
MEIIWSRAADRDLTKIYAYLEPRSLRAAREVLRHLFKAIDRLAEMPRLGTLTDLGAEREYRQFVVEHYKIFYYIGQEQLIIVRLWDTRQDPTKFFVPPSP